MGQEGKGKRNMPKVLLKFQADYADEFDVYGLRIVDKDEWEKEKEHIRSQKFVEQNGKWPQEKYFGTNEGIVFESPEELIGSYKEIEITDNEAKILEKLRIDFFGWTPEF